MPNVESILDIGSGTGALLSQLSLAVPNAALSGIDPANRMVEVATKTVPKAKLICGTAEKIPYTNSSFDLVVSTSSFNHWKNQQKGFMEIYRVLSPHGRLILADNFAIGPLSYATAFLLKKRERIKTRHEIEAMLKSAGFSSLQWKTIVKLGPFPVTHIFNSRKFG